MIEVIWSGVELAKDVLSQGDRAIELQTNGENLKLEKYVEQIINQAIEQQSNKI
ncbi:MAG: hypothetical protein ACRC1Z_15790 [Waterburya sp.]